MCDLCRGCGISGETKAQAGERKPAADQRSQQATLIVESTSPFYCIHTYSDGYLTTAVFDGNFSESIHIIFIY